MAWTLISTMSSATVNSTAHSFERDNARLRYRYLSMLAIACLPGLQLFSLSNIVAIAAAMCTAAGGHRSAVPLKRDLELKME